MPAQSIKYVNYILTRMYIFISVIGFYVQVKKKKQLIWLQLKVMMNIINYHYFCVLI